ncbi:MAG: DUF4082 domain-containing protein, partial [Betaproteobacteria bacterium]
MLSIPALGSAAIATTTTATATTAATTAAATTATTTTSSITTLWPATAVPVIAASAESRAIEVGVKFRSDTNGFISGIRFYKSTANTGTHLGHLWDRSGKLLATGTFTNETASGWQQVLFSAPVAIAAGTTYVASYHTDAGYYAADNSYFAVKGVDSPPLHALKDAVDGGNGVYAYGPSGTFPNSSHIATNYWVDVVYSPASPCPCALWPASAVPVAAADGDVKSIEVGVKFRSDIAGEITSIRFYKFATNTGIHVGTLWSRDGVKLGQVTFANETASGWQQATFLKPIAISAGVTYVASYHAPVGHYADDTDSNGFLAGRDSPPLHALKDGVDGPNGVYTYSSGSTFPRQTFKSSNYWVDVAFSTPIAGDPVTPPTPPTPTPPTPPTPTPPAPTPPAPTPPTPTPPSSGTAFIAGVNTHLQPFIGSFNPFFDHLVELGVKSWRQDFGWRWVEKQKGVLAFSDAAAANFDAFVTRTANAGIEPVFVLCYGNPFYDGGGFPVSAEGQAAFVRYAVFVATHYKGRVKKYEVWNEWNAGIGTPNRIPGDAASYNKLLSKVYAALKNVDASITVLGGVATPNMPWSVGLFATGALSSMDAYSIHPYLYPQVPEKSLAFMATLENNAKVYSGGRDVPLYATEVGWPTHQQTDGVSTAAA